jgi:hypothetical protein
VRGERSPLLDEIGRNRAHLQAEKILYLTGKDDHGDPRGESGDDWIRDEFDQRAEAGQPEKNEDYARDDGADDEAVVPEFRHDAVDDHHERPRRSADLHAAAAKSGDEEPGHDGGVEAALRRDPRGNRKRKRQRQRHDSDDDSGDQVSRERLAREALTKTDDRLRNEHSRRL